MAKIEEAIEMLRCAEINCDNVLRGVPVGVVKLQIQEAIKLLEGGDGD